ncbi:MAG: outer membrane beta-barrel protein [Bacteroidales bacterium]|nr:outer membrane beta-barrel protein [Bacteroidales bacterium]
MKKTVFTTLFVLLAAMLFAQQNSSLTWFGLGLKGGYGTSFLFNKASVDDAKVTYAYYSPSYFFGGDFGLVFGDYIGVSVEYTFNNFSQAYDVQGAENFKRIISCKSNDLGFLLNLQAETGFYFDIGPKFSTLKTAMLSTTSSVGTIEMDRTNKFRPEFSSIVLGVGLKPLITQSFEIKIGVRGVYTFSNIVNTPGYIIAADDNVLYMPNYSEEKTNPIQLMLTTEFTLVFGKFGKARCGKNRFMFNF